jgi:hypothetical protein
MEGNRPKSRLAPAMMVTVIVLAMIALYVGGYLRGSRSTTTRGERLHNFGAKWKCMVYWPAAEVESLVIGAPVYLCYPTGPHEYTAYE